MKRGRPKRSEERLDLLSVAAAAVWSLMHSGARHPGALARVTLRGRPKKRTGLTLDEAVERVEALGLEVRLEMLREARKELTAFCSPEQLAVFDRVIKDESHMRPYVGAADAKRAYLDAFGPAAKPVARRRMIRVLREQALARGERDPHSTIAVDGSTTTKQ